MLRIGPDSDDETWNCVEIDDRLDLCPKDSVSFPRKDIESAFGTIALTGVFRIQSGDDKSSRTWRRVRPRLIDSRVEFLIDDSLSGSYLTHF